MSKLRELARGKPCMVRIPGICNGNPETTVLAHVRIIGVSGMGIKAPDIFGAWSCSACHDYVDNRRKNSAGSVQRRLDLLEGMVRTQYELVQLGHLTEAERVTE
jgi:hypothetical protein